MRVGELARRAGVSVRSVRHYEAMGLLTPERRANGYRSFGDDDVRRIELIRRFQGVGFSLAEIRDLAPCWQGDRSVDAHRADEMEALYRRKLADVDHQMTQLALIRDELRRRLAPGDSPDEATKGAAAWTSN